MNSMTYSSNPSHSDSDNCNSSQSSTSLLENMTPKSDVFDARENNLAFIRNVILFALLAQNSGYTLLRKLSTSTEEVSSREILLVGELVKLFVSSIIVVNSSEPSSSVGKGMAKLVWVISNSKKMLVLAGIYLGMNVLSFISLTYIGAGEFSVCAQLKILTTAGCSVLVLQTSLSPTKWRALGLLVVGCVLVISPSLELQQKQKQSSTSGSVDSAFSVLVFGYGAVLLEVLLSGFASIYFEKVVKSTTEVVTIWERNMQLSFYSIIIYVCMISYDCNISEAPKVLGQNWSGLTVLVAFLGAFGGLLVAATLKYADSILKTLSTAGAIVVSTVLGHFLLGSPLNYIMALGASCVIFAIFNYTMDATPSPIMSVKDNTSPLHTHSSSDKNPASSSTQSAA